MDAATAVIDNRNWLWAVVYARLGDSLATEDVLQEVSVAAVRSDRMFADIKQMRAWLYQVAIRQVMLLKRREGRHRCKIRSYAVSRPTKHFEQFVDWLGDDTLQSQRVEQVQKAVALIKPSDRQVLALKYMQGLSCLQIAEMLNVSETTIQSRLLRARRRLRHVLIQDFEFDPTESEGH